MTQALPLDELVVRLRARALDPERRTSTRPSELMAGVRTLDLGGLLTMGRSLSDSLRGVVAANRTGHVDPAASAQAKALESAMTTPAATVLPGPADEAWIALTERALGVRLPSALRRVYAEVADGGFGPGEGLLPLSAVVAQYEELQSPGMMPHGRTWPAGLLPLVSMDPGWDCVDCAAGAVVAWDPDGLSERSSQAVFARSFREIFPTVEAWLTDWLTSKTQAEAQAEMMAHVMSNDYQVNQAREARAAIGRMSPEERRKMGLPEVGWERVVWGGLGWDEPEGGEPA
jgi:hypothetical protein